MPLTTHAHLRRDDKRLFQHSVRDRSVQIEDGSRDAEIWARRVGYLQAGATLEDARAYATVQVQITAPDDAGVTLAAGAAVAASAAPALGEVRYLLDEALTLAAGEGAEVTCTCDTWGRVGNLPAGTLAAVVGAPAALVVQGQAAAGGEDHALTDLATLYTRERIYVDLTTGADDAWQALHRIVMARRKELCDDLIKGGLPSSEPATQIGTRPAGAFTPKRTSRG